MSIALRPAVLASLALAVPLRAQVLLDSHFGASANSHFGAGIDVREDYDADGMPDIVVGEPDYLNGSTWNGRVVVLSGATGAMVGSAIGATNEQIGERVASAGDLDGDGVPDVFAAAPGWFFQRGLVTARSVATGATLWTVTATVNGAYFGSGIAAIDDVTGDGIDELVAVSSDPMTVGVRILSGANGTVVRVHATGGTDCAQLDDVDGDGTGDYAVGRYGSVTIYSGASGATLRTIAPGGTSGFEILAIGDFDGDAIGDVAVGVPNFGARIYSPATGGLLRTIHPPPPGCAGDGFGNRLGPAGDVDLDGIPDMWLGTTNGGYARLASGATGAEILTYRGGGIFGGGYFQADLSFASLPDRTGDGRPEFVVADPLTYPSPGAIGQVAVYAGTASNSVGSASCFGDGGGTPCPCGNSGGAGAGCANSTGAGADLAAWGSSSASTDNLWFRARQLPGASALLFAGTTALNGGLGVAQFDGLRCAGGTVRRLAYFFYCTGSDAATGPRLQPQGLWTAGSTRYFQAYYRNVAGPCGSGVNFTNLVTVVLGP